MQTHACTSAMPAFQNSDCREQHPQPAHLLIVIANMYHSQDKLKTVAPPALYSTALSLLFAQHCLPSQEGFCFYVQEGFDGGFWGCGTCQVLYAETFYHPYHHNQNNVCHVLYHPVGANHCDICPACHNLWEDSGSCCDFWCNHCCVFYIFQRASSEVPC